LVSCDECEDRSKMDCEECGGTAYIEVVCETCSGEGTRAA